MALTKVSRELLNTSIVDNGNATAITIDSSENVGIGTASPSSLMHLSANTGATLTLESTDTGIATNEVIGEIDFFSNDASGIGAASRGSISLIAQDAAGAGSMLFKTSNASTASAERMRIDSSGRVGIGTSSPSSFAGDCTLALNDSGGARLGLNGSSRFFYMGCDSGSDRLEIGRRISSNTTDSPDFVLTGSGHVGIGTSAPAGPLQVYGSDYVYISPNVANKTPNSTHAGIALGWNKSSGQGESIIAYNKGAGSPGGLVFADYSGTYAERMRINSSGDLLVGCTTTPSASVDGVMITRTPNITSSRSSTTNSSTTSHWLFYNSNGIVGSIGTVGSATLYNTSSDYRLKTDAQPMTGATARLKALKPVNFEWIADGTRVDGFLAHEAQAVVPECVTGEKDAMMEEEYEVSPAVLDEEGNTVEEAVMGTRSVPDYQGIDQSKLVPLLVATIQELEARITELENN